MWVESGPARSVKLLRRYPSDQLWLPFDNNIFVYQVEEEPRTPIVKPYNLSKRANAPFARRPNPRPLDYDPHQHAFYFAREKRLTHRQWEKIGNAEGWARKSDGRMLTASINDQPEALHWMSMMFEGSYYRNKSGVIYIQLEEDYIALMMKYG